MSSKISWGSHRNGHCDPRSIGYNREPPCKVGGKAICPSRISDHGEMGRPFIVRESDPSRWEINIQNVQQLLYIRS